LPLIVTDQVPFRSPFSRCNLKESLIKSRQETR
jgi:hypothetical protein